MRNTHIEIMFVALSDMNVVSKVDAFFSNLKFPWSKDKDVQAIIGAVLAFRVSKAEDNSNWKFERIWAKTYGVQTSVLAWSTQLGLLTVGMDNGKVNSIRVTAESQYKKNEDVFGLLII